MDEFPWSIGVFDAHCHPTDTLASLAAVPSMRARVLTVMATRSQDQHLVAETADKYGIRLADIEDETTDWSSQHRVTPAFGWHPWFSYQMFFSSDYDGSKKLSTEQKLQHYQEVLVPRPEDEAFLHSLPNPQSFDEFLNTMAEHIKTYPLALLGEVGLDKAFRIPESWLPEHLADRNASLTPGGREGRTLSPYRVNMEHQRRILKAQLKLAGELGRAASVHGVQAHGIVFQTLSETWRGHERQALSKRDRKRAATSGLNAAGLTAADAQTHHQTEPKPFPPRICLHSFSGPAETVKQYLNPSTPCDVFFSFSTTINSWTEDGQGKVEAAVRAVPDDRILIESDLHTAGDKMDDYLEAVARRICHVKDWTLQHGVGQLARNWKHFVAGIDVPLQSTVL